MLRLKSSVSKIKKSSRSHAHKIQALKLPWNKEQERWVRPLKRFYRAFINVMKKKTKKMNEGWSDKYKKSIDCNNPKGFSQRGTLSRKEKDL